MGIIRYLALWAQIEIYVDWADESMPRVTSRETAERLKARIRQMDVFMVLATDNACASRWVPWEIGIADEAKAHDRIAIIPVSDASGVFHGNEYLQLYNRLELTKDKEPLIVPPNTHIGRYYKSWSAEKARR